MKTIATAVSVLTLTSLASFAQTLDIPSFLAVEAAQAAIAACAEKGHHTTVAVVNAEGVLRAAIRGDGAQAMAYDSARMKATTIVNLGVMRGVPTTLELNEKLGSAAPQLAAIGYSLAGGGAAIKRGDVVIGGLGIAGAPGGNLDQDCANAGVAKISGRL